MADADWHYEFLYGTVVENYGLFQSVVTCRQMCSHLSLGFMSVLSLGYSKGIDGQLDMGLGTIQAFEEGS